MAAKYPPIPDPAADVNALSRSGQALKETAEILTGLRGDRAASAVTWQDLVDLGLITPAQIPVTIGNR